MVSLVKTHYHDESTYQLRREHLLDSLVRNKFHLGKVAKELGISESTVQRKVYWWDLHLEGPAEGAVGWRLPPRLSEEKREELYQRMKQRQTKTQIKKEMKLGGIMDIEIDFLIKAKRLTR